VSAESFNAKLKSFRATFRGVDDVRFYLTPAKVGGVVLLSK